MKLLTAYLVVGFLLAAMSASIAQHRYEVIVKDLEKITVTASLNLQEPQIHMPIMSGEELPDGPATFIKKLSVRNPSGSEIEIEGTENRGNHFTWKLGGAMGRVELRYEVELRHDQYEWPFGVEEIGYRTKEGVMIIGRYLFIVPDFSESTAYEINFDLPPAWKISTPWTISGEPNSFTVRHASEVRDNVLFIGSHQEEKITVGSTQLHLVLGPGLQEDRNRILNYLQPNMKKIESLFGASPRSSYLVVMQEGPIAGGAFNQSYSMLVEKPINQGTSALWGHGMIHETFHLWNGRGLVPREQMEWFREGVTEYLSIWIQAQTGTMERKIIEKKLENAYRRSFLAKVMGQSMSLQEAGDNKNQNRMKIYGMGTFFSFLLDIEIRNASANRYGLSEVLKRMYTDFVPKGKEYGLQDVVHYVNTVSGKDLSWLFDNYVTGVSPLAANDHLQKAGLHLNSMYDEAYLSYLPGVDSLQKEIRQGIFGQSVQ